MAHRTGMARSEEPHRVEQQVYPLLIDQPPTYRTSKASVAVGDIGNRFEWQAVADDFSAAMIIRSGEAHSAAG